MGDKSWVEVFIIIIIFSLSWENEIGGQKARWKFFIIIIIFSFSFLGERDSGDKGWVEVFFFYYFFFFFLGRMR